MHIGDRNNLGWLVLRDHSPTADADLRNVPGALLQTGWTGEDKPEPRSFGDLVGGMVWDNNDGDRFEMSAWFLTGAPVYSNTKEGTTTDKDWSLQFDVDERDERLETKDLAVPEWFKGKFPRSHPGLASAAVREDAQVDLLHPSFFGMFSPQKFGPSSTGTYIYDLDDESKPDKERQVQLQQWMRVADLGPGGVCGFSGYVPAIQLGLDSLDRRSGGMALADGNATGITNAAAGGPFTLGVGQCVHQTAGPDGPMGPVHLATSSLFLGLEHDGQLHFEPDIVDWVGMRDEGIPTRTHLAWEPTLPTVAGCQRSAGRWVWYTRTPFYVGEPPRTDPDRQFALIDYSRRITGGGDPGGVTGDGGTGVITDGFERVGGDGEGGTGVISDGSKMVHATTPYCLEAPCVVFKPQDPTKGAMHAYDDLSSYAKNSPVTAKIAGFGKVDAAADGFVKEAGTKTSHPVGTGGFAIIPPDVDQFAVFRGEAPTTNYQVQFTIPNGLAQLAFGDVGTNGLTQTGMVIETGTGGRLDFKTVDSSGTVTATAYIPSGASGDISGAAGSGDVTGPASSTDGNVVSFNGTTGKIVQDSGVAAADLIAKSGTLTSGNVISNNGTQITDSGIVASQVVAINTGGASANDAAVWSGSAWTAVNLQLDTHISDVDLTGLADGQGITFDSGSGTWLPADVGLPTGSQYDILAHNGTSFVAQSNLDIRHDPGGAAGTDYAAYISNTHSQSATQDQVAARFVCPNNTYNFSTGGTTIQIEGASGTLCGFITARRVSSSIGKLVLGYGSAGASSGTLVLENPTGSFNVCGVYGSGIISIDDVISVKPTISGKGAIYMKSGALYANVGGSNEVQLAGSASLQTDFQNSDIVNTSASSSGEVLVYNGSTFDAADINTQSGEGGSSRVKKTASNTVTAASGATVTATNLIPAKCRVIAVTVVVTTSLGTSNGTTGFTVGDGSTANRWGTDTAATTAGTSTGPDDYGTTADQCCFWNSSAQSVVITAQGGNFDGTGEFRVVVYYEEINLPTS